jgi:6-phosphogluconolactonase (cycloisomerase 2 family)
LCSLGSVAYTQSTASSPVAWVYVSNYIGNTTATEVHAYSVLPNGVLKPIPGSPFNDGITTMAVNGKYLMGGTDNDININAYHLNADGSPSFWTQTNITHQNSGCGGVGSIFFDHTGSSLYNEDPWGSQCSNNTYEAFNVVKSNGALTFVGDAGSSEALNGKLTFLANNVYAYGSTCYHSSPSINGFKRNSDGSLTQLNMTPAYPAAPTGEGWCPWLAAADPTSHVVIPMQPYAGYGDPAGPYQLAVYTADASGNLTTTSSYTDMPGVTVGGVNDLDMAPSGKIVAVSGPDGLQIFHVNGASPVTPYAVLNSTDAISQVFWDNANHLYAVSQTSGKLFVYTVTQTGWSAAPGSPVTISGALGLIVQPLPRY